jgi:hypothetical protein
VRDRRWWGTPEYTSSTAERLAASASAEDKAALGEMIRQSASPGAAVELARMNMSIDIRHVLPSVRVPTLGDLVAGSGIQFRERGVAELKGVPGEWRLFAVEQA